MRDITIITCNVIIFILIFGVTASFAFQPTVDLAGKLVPSAVDSNFRNIVYEKVTIPPATTSVSLEFAVDTNSVVLATLNTDTTGVSIRSVVPTYNLATINFTGTIYDTLEVSVMAITK